MNKIKGVKAFDREMKCRGFQFEEGKSYKHVEDVIVCKSGFHFCENPIDTFLYYEPGSSIFCNVEGSGKISKHNNDSKVACGKLKIGEKISMHDLIGISINFMFSRNHKKTTHSKSDRSASSATGDESASSATGDRSASSATGYESASSATGDRSASSATGNRSASSATGYESASSATGNRSASSATGDGSASSATGDESASSATGDRSASSATGDRSASSATGYGSASSATGYESASSATGMSSAAISTGLNSKAMAGEYSVIALQWWDKDKKRCEMRCAEVGCGDGTDGKLKSKVWYKLDGYGNFVEE